MRQGAYGRVRIEPHADDGNRAARARDRVAQPDQRVVLAVVVRLGDDVDPRARNAANAVAGARS